MTATDIIDRRLPPAQDSALSFKAIALALFRNRKICAAILLGSWALAAVAILLSPTTYEASTQVLLEPLPRKPVSVVLDGVADPLDSAQADSRLQVVKSERLLRFVFNTIDWPKLNGGPQPGADRNFLQRWLENARALLHPDTMDEKSRKTKALLDFMSCVSVKRLGLSYVIEISFRASTPQLAASVANSITAAYLHSLITSAQFDDELLQRRLANVENEKIVLLDAIDKGIIPDRTFPDANARVISAAFEPLSGSSPRPILIVLMATALGIAGAFFVSISRHGADRSIRTGRETFIPSYLKPLAVCRKGRGARTRQERGGAGTSDFGPFLMQRLLARQDERYSIIGFVAYSPKSGTTHVTGAIGLEMRRYGIRSTIVDADGLSYAGRSRTPIHQPHVADRQCGKISSEKTGPGAQAHLGPARPVDKIQLMDLAAQGPVLVDLPALTTSFDALAVAPLLDVVVLVADAGMTTVDGLVHATQLLDSEHVVGFVLNEGARKRRDSRLWPKSVVFDELGHSLGRACRSLWASTHRPI